MEGSSTRGGHLYAISGFGSLTDRDLNELEAQFKAHLFQVVVCGPIIMSIHPPETIESI